MYRKEREMDVEIKLVRQGMFRVYGLGCWVFGARAVREW